MVLLPRVSVLTLMLETSPGKQECSGKHWVPSNSQQFVWLEELRTVSQFRKSLMNAPLLTMTHIETEESLRGSCYWERHRQTGRFAKILNSGNTASACEGRVVQGVHRGGAVTESSENVPQQPGWHAQQDWMLNCASVSSPISQDLPPCVSPCLPEPPSHLNRTCL